MAGSSGLLIRLGMTLVALKGKTLELSNRSALMACGTIERGVRTEQGEPVLVVLNGSHGYHPGFHVVTPLAARPHLPAVNIGVTICAPCACVGENWLKVTLPTSDASVGTK